jgi:hypothetical protein
MQLLHKHKARLMFPVDHFRWHAAWALIATESQNDADARAHAHCALAEAARDHSGFRYHPAIGLVSTQCVGLVEDLKGLCAYEA